MIDGIRGGRLLEALDALAGRFIAVEAATHDGWNIAKHLEVAVPSEQAIAPAELQLAARRHNNLVSRAQGFEGKGTWRYAAGGRGWGSGGGGREDNKGWWRSKGSGKDGKEALVPVQMVLSCLPGASLVPRRLSNWSESRFWTGTGFCLNFSTTLMANGPVRGKSWGGPHGRL